MTTNINLNLNQSPYFDDYDETKDSISQNKITDKLINTIKKIKELTA